MPGIVGPSYELTVRPASVQRAVNLYLAGIEVPDVAPFMLDSAPGLILFADKSALGPCRGQIEVRGRTFAVFGSSFCEVFTDGTVTVLGLLLSAIGAVSMDFGLSQLCVVDGANGYVLTLATSAFAQISSAGFYGSVRVRYLDGYFIFIKASSRIFYISAFEDATTFDPLDFASAEGGPDNLVSLEVSHGELWLFCVLRTEVWTNSGGADFPFARNQGASIEVGCVAAQAVLKADNSLYWIGRDSNGQGQVFRATGYTPQRVSKHNVEQQLQLSSDLTSAVIYGYQDTGFTFVCISAPGLLSAWVYEVSTGQWHERCDTSPIDGSFTADRSVNHSYSFGKHLVGDVSGKLYQLDKGTYTKAGDPLVRMRVTPHTALPGRMRQFFTQFWIDVTTGEAGQGVDTNVELSWSGDSGATYSNPILRSIGLVGQRFARLLWTLLGSDRDRVWKIKYSGNAPFAIVDGGAEAKPGRA